MSEIIPTKGFGRSLSELYPSNNFLDPETIVEISRRNETNNWTSYKTRLKCIDAAIIDKFKLYKNLNNIFDSSVYPRETYFGNDKTIFADNPKIYDEIYNTNLNDSKISQNHLVTKSLIDGYLLEDGICVPVHSSDSDYYYYSSDKKGWIKDNNLIPLVLSPTMDGIWTSFSKLKFNYGTNIYAFTDDVITPKNIMLDVTGNILLDEEYQEEWYKENQNYFVALTINGNLITLQFLKNILLLKNNKGSNYVIAQFHFHCPLAKRTKFKIITNAECKLFGLPTEDQFSRKLYNSLNAVNLGFYDFVKSI